jgi:hypothetical protein
MACYLQYYEHDPSKKMKWPEHVTGSEKRSWAQESEDQKVVLVNNSTMPSVAGLYRTDWQSHVWKWLWSKLSWPIRGIDNGLEEQRKSTKKTLASRWSGRDSNWAPREYEWKALPLCQSVRRRDEPTWQTWRRWKNINKMTKIQWWDFVNLVTNTQFH